MSETSSQVGAIPELTLGWRLKMALGSLRVEEMAEELGVNRATVSRWMSDKGAPPKTAYIKQWALRTGVPYVWLDEGKVSKPDPEGGTSLPRVDSNHQPAG